MAVRWECPDCGSGVNAPERPRRDDVRRYCLRCSEQTGRLVARTSPVLERRRAQAALRQRSREQLARDREREARRARWEVTLLDANAVERVLDVRKELKRALTDGGFFEGWARGHRPTIDEVDVTVRRGQKSHHTGRAGGFEVVFTFGQAGYEAALELIYHEAAHLCAPAGEHHGSGFRRKLADMLQARWPWIRYGAVTSGAVYDADAAVTLQMCRHVREGGEL